MTTHTIDLVTRDGERVSFPCDETESVVAAAAKANLTLPGHCREGGCGACRATASEGDYHLAGHSASALPAEAANAREVLLCRTFPRGDLSIAAPFDRSHILSGPVAERQAEIVERALVGERTVRLLISLVPDEDNGNAAEFEAGQYMELEIPGTGVRRAYSLSNTANWLGHLEFLIRLQPGGRFSHWLEHEARPGQILSVRGPQGSFTLQERGLRPRWFVAGGTGLAPMLSMLRRMAEWQEPQEARLYFGVSVEAELFALDELERLKAELPKLTVVPCVWKPGAGWTGFAGTPVDALRRDLADAKTAPDIYLCGPPALIDAAEAAARDHDVPADHLFSERFLPS
ncbi:aromatic/alkene monooxygenase hydroxylase FAD-binding subunit MmoC [Azospirillum soli]|uniref:aromatic/alkene monooxygenase hydroxylase FAD-binding subunit MmoC n=1 Tax=Azospirillum soli TaxID=1304799 RepID=UPI001AEA12D4|nr:2Fe-2S iron-sulfur cluster binding domain-containing protein [Azospirillum soli]MBP2312650.1 ferredoxin-NADP reductase/ferredoxin [Azospirillum soli]